MIKKQVLLKRTSSENCKTFHGTSSLNINYLYFMMKVFMFHNYYVVSIVKDT